MSSWAQLDEEGIRYLLGDEQGHLILLSFNHQRLALEVILLGEVFFAFSFFFMTIFLLI